MSDTPESSEKRIYYSVTFLNREDNEIYEAVFGVLPECDTALGLADVIEEHLGGKPITLQSVTKITIH